jgi:hypothetical protein
MAHTPEPWEVDGPFRPEEYWFGGGYWRIWFADRDDVFCDQYCVIPAQGKNAEANARLIAAAPTMYDELKKARDNLQMMVTDNILEYYDFAGIDAALRKAEGGER